jgi:hypothetical protein
MLFTKSPVIVVNRSKAVAIATLGHFDERPDDFGDIAARTEVPAGAL